MSTATPAAAGPDASEGAGDGVRSAASDVAQSDWGDRGARIGIAARGVVFVVLGYLVARIALGALGDSGGTGKSASGTGVADAIAAQTGGRVVLLVLGIGLVLYALLSLLQMVRDPEGEPSDVKRWGARLRAAWQAVLYAAFAVYCLHTAAASSSGQGSARHSSRQQQEWTARVLRWPAGWFWLMVAGLVLLVMAVYQAQYGVRRRFFDDLKTARMGRAATRFATVVGIGGHLGRAATFALVGWFVLQAAIENDPDKGRGVDGSARMLANSTGGPYLLWLLAIGLALFGVYQFVESRYRRV